MSVDYNSYLGPYARCRVEKVEGYRRGCVSESCPHYRKEQQGEFCSMCGGRQSMFSVPGLRERVDAFELFQNEALANCLLDANGNFRAFVPNTRRGTTTREFRFRMHDAWEQPLVSNQPQLEAEWFERVFALEIEKLREVYGPDRVEIAWGWFSCTT